MESIQYPNALQDIVVLEFKAETIIGFTIRPLRPGAYRLLVWPDGLPDPDCFSHKALLFETAAGAPKHCAIDLSGFRPYSMHTWRWALRLSSEAATPLDDLAGVVLDDVAIVASGSFDLYDKSRSDEVRLTAWSCHQPYETGDNSGAVLGAHSNEILEWYAERVFKFQPHVIWGQGDTAYSDGCETTDFANQVYDKGGWYKNPDNRLWLKEEYRNMYRHFWSLEPMRKVMTTFPHLFIWDDHEIRDGWGSEGKDFEPGNLEMFKVAKEIAQEYILNTGPRVRCCGEEAHQAYIMGNMAAFIFDTRSKRNYEASKERLISREQFQDFIQFLDDVSKHAELTDLVLCTTVPFVNLRSWVTDSISKVPDIINDHFLNGVRDDVRDAWTSPGNIDTLEEVLAAIAKFMRNRPEVRACNISGDIHVANAFEIWLPGVVRPFYQITTSAITNRTHPPGWIEAITEIKDGSHIEGVGYVRRVWETVTDPNVLFARFGYGRVEFTLQVWNEELSNSCDLNLTI